MRSHRLRFRPGRRPLTALRPTLPRTGRRRALTVAVVTALALTAVAVPLLNQPADAPGAPAVQAVPVGRPVGNALLRSDGAAAAVPAGTPIPGRYVVVLHDGRQPRTPDETGGVARDLIDRHGGKLATVYTTALRGFSAELPADAAKSIAADPRVASVTQDRSVAPTAVQVDPSWNLDRADQNQRFLSGTYDYSTDASGVHIYVLDTGVRASHQDFGGRVRTGPAPTDHNDCGGHGTAVASAAAGAVNGVAKGATIHAIRTINCTTVSGAADGIGAIDWLTAHGPRPAVVNLSWTTAANDALDTAIRNSIAAGVTYVVAAGNNKTDACGTSPQRISEAIVVGAANRDDNRADFSSYGSCLDLFAPGTDIGIATYDSDTSTGASSGTSLAAPMVAGAAALHLARNPAAKPAEVSAALRGCATPGLLGDIRAGSPNLLLNTRCGEMYVVNPGRQATGVGQPVTLPAATLVGGSPGTVRFSATGLPTGVSVDATTGVMSGTPTVTGVTRVGVTGTDATGAKGFTSFLWDVTLGAGQLVGLDGRCADNESARVADGNRIIVWDCHSGSSQQWTGHGDGRLTVQGRCMTVRDNGTADGTPIVLHECRGGSGQIWVRGATGGELLNPASGRCLTAPRADLQTQLTVADCTGTNGQKWTFKPTTTVTVRFADLQISRVQEPVWAKTLADTSDTTRPLAYTATGLPPGLKIDATTGVISGQPGTAGVYDVRLTATDPAGISGSKSLRWQVAHGTVTGLNGWCADNRDGSSNAGTPVQLWTCHSQNGQLVTVGADGTLRSVDKCLTADGTATDRGVPVVLAVCAGTADQIWQPAADGTLRNPSSGHCLTAPTAVLGAQLRLAACTGAIGQQWTLPTSTVTVQNPGDQLWTAGVAVDVTVGVGGTGGAPRFAATGLPAGLTIGASTGRITGTPAAAASGGVTVTVTRDGATARVAFSWRVSHGPIRAVGSDKCLDNLRGGTADGNPVISWGCSRTDSQQWTVRADDRLSVQGRCLTVLGGRRDDGAPLGLTDCGTADSQIWQQMPGGALRNPASGLCVTATRSDLQTPVALGSCTDGPSRRWTLPTAPQVTDPGPQRTPEGAPVHLPIRAVAPLGGTLAFTADGLPAGLRIDERTGVVTGVPTSAGTSQVTVTVTAGKAFGSVVLTWVVAARQAGEFVHVGGSCLDVDMGKRDDGTPVQLYECIQSSGQRWTARPDGRLSALTDRCLTPAGNGTTDGTPVVSITCGTAESQVWQARADHTILNPASGLCLDTPGTASKARVRLAPCTGDRNQQFLLPKPVS